MSIPKKSGNLLNAPRTYHTKLFGVFETHKKSENFNRYILSLLLEILSNDATNE